MPSALDHVADLGCLRGGLTVVPPRCGRRRAAGWRPPALPRKMSQRSGAPEPGGHYVVRDGALVAWRIPDAARSFMPFRILGSHTDSDGFHAQAKT